MIDKKTIYYDNAIIKIYDIPILYLPRLSHPDPSVKRRSGFLVPTFKNSRDLGQEVSIPYFWNINHDKNFTFTPKLFVDENPYSLVNMNRLMKVHHSYQILVTLKVTKKLVVKRKKETNLTFL